MAVNPDDAYAMIKKSIPPRRPFLLKLFNAYIQTMLYHSKFSFIFQWKSLEPFGQSNQDFRSYDDRALQAMALEDTAFEGMQTLTDLIAVSRSARSLAFYNYLTSYFFQLFEVGLVDSSSHPLGATVTDADTLGSVYVTDSAEPIVFERLDYT